jgi:hypothetical protein
MIVKIIPILVPALDRSDVKLAQHEGNKLWIAAPKYPNILTQIKPPVSVVTCDHMYRHNAAEKIVGINTFMAPKNRSARMADIIRPGIPTAFMAMSIRNESEAEPPSLSVAY